MIQNIPNPEDPKAKPSKTEEAPKAAKENPSVPPACDAPRQGPILTRKEIESSLEIALWAALMAAGAWIAIPIGPVPITLQTFFIALAGFAMGPVRGFLSACLYVLAGLLGFPAFAGGVSGPALLLGPTAGYALSFPLGAFVSGLAYNKDGPMKSAWVYLFWGFLGTIPVLLGGSLGLMVNMKMSLSKALLANIPFLPGNLIKLFGSVLVARSLNSRRRKSSSLANEGGPSEG
jgi:biotin transport system substrate-specific component